MKDDIAGMIATDVDSHLSTKIFEYYIASLA